MDEAEAGTTASRARVEIGVERGRGGRYQRGRRRDASSRGRGRGSTRAAEIAEQGSEGAPEAARMPDLRWEISVRDRTGARVIVDIPCLPCPDMNLPAQVTLIRQHRIRL